MKAYLIGQTMLNYAAFKQYLLDEDIDFESDAFSAAAELIEIAGRVCYLSFEGGRPAQGDDTRNETYIKHILKVNHGSVLEHVTFNWLLTGIDRMVSHELVRHRVGTAFSQVSTRYVDQFGKMAEPFARRKELNGNKDVDDYFDEATRIYKAVMADLQHLGGKKAREIAATLLPGAIQTQMVFSVNLRELRHIFAMRCGLAANAAIRDLCMEMYRQVEKCWPLLVCDFRIFNSVVGQYLVQEPLA